MVRSQCQVLESHGGGIAGAMLTIRLSPAAGQGDALHARLRLLLSALPQRPGVVSAHLLQTQTPQAGVTAEQKIRGGADAVADWIVLVAGYEPQALLDLAAGELGRQALAAAGASPEQVTGLYRLSAALTPADL